MTRGLEMNWNWTHRTSKPVTGRRQEQIWMFLPDNLANSALNHKSISLFSIEDLQG